MKAHTVTWILLALAAGCVSAPETRYYTLDMRPAAGSEAGCAILIDRIRVAEPLVRKDLLIKKNATQIEYYATDQWAAGLDELVTEKLRAEFGTAQHGQPLFLSGSLLAFEQVDVPGGAMARAKLRVELRRGHRGDILVERNYEAEQSADRPGAPAIVTALSTCLEDIARQIVADATAL